MDQTDEPTRPEPDVADEAATAPSAANDPPAPAPTEAPEEPGPGDGTDEAAAEGPAVEAAVPVEEPVDGAPTPVAAPAEGPVSAAAHDGSARPKPAIGKVTPVLVAVAVAWVLKKLLTRSRG